MNIYRRRRLWWDQYSHGVTPIDTNTHTDTDTHTHKRYVICTRSRLRSDPPTSVPRFPTDSDQLQRGSGTDRGGRRHGIDFASRSDESLVVFAFGRSRCPDFRDRFRQVTDGFQRVIRFLCLRRFPDLRGR